MNVNFTNQIDPFWSASNTNIEFFEYHSVGLDVRIIPPAGYLGLDEYRFIGHLPNGLIFDERTGIISGTTTDVGNYSYVIVGKNNADSLFFEGALQLLRDTDNDGDPDELPNNYTGSLIEDNDDDGDGVHDEIDSHPLDSSKSSESKYQWMLLISLMIVILIYANNLRFVKSQSSNSRKSNPSEEE